MDGGGVRGYIHNEMQNARRAVSWKDAGTMWFSLGWVSRAVFVTICLVHFVVFSGGISTRRLCMSGAQVALHGELWRVVSAPFVHGGFFHLVAAVFFFFLRKCLCLFVHHRTSNRRFST